MYNNKPRKYPYIIQEKLLHNKLKKNLINHLEVYTESETVSLRKYKKKNS